MGWLDRFTDLIGEVDRAGRLKETAAAERSHSLSTGRRALNARFQAEGAVAVRDHAAAAGDRSGAVAADRLVKSKTARAKAWDERGGHSKW